MRNTIWSCQYSGRGVGAADTGMLHQLKPGGIYITSGIIDDKERRL